MLSIVSWLFTLGVALVARFIPNVALKPSSFSPISACVFGFRPGLFCWTRVLARDWKATPTSLTDHEIGLRAHLMSSQRDQLFNNNIRMKSSAEETKQFDYN